MKYIFFCSILVLLMSCRQSKNQNEESSSQKTDSMTSITPENHSKNVLIVPGKRLGMVTLNQDAKPVFDHFGKPDTGEASMGKASATWHIKTNDQKSVLTIFTTRKMGVENFSRIKFVRTTSTVFKTKNGIGVGSTLKSIETQFELKKIGSFIENGKTYSLEGTAKGIAFEIGPDKKCHGIVVHPKNLKANETYIPIYENLKKSQDLIDCRDTFLKTTLFWTFSAYAESNTALPLRQSLKGITSFQL